MEKSASMLSDASPNNKSLSFGIFRYFFLTNTHSAATTPWQAQYWELGNTELTISIL